ncbi:hypothetical protein F5J12DRAFT_779751 [Pisolithus orientalis]|uniref:uncharacterized protein n=1 Tax=Pisolithus orientalis TaxID=936130 RepID=UPI0022242204|nr:uncharacterized protein F5J12DRAFT_779751 [Pisolithus orientalis]KAI6030653.1 hypothetical protein F5J12DRAFT_779751 [Pisolithus orientalis]
MTFKGSKPLRAAKGTKPLALGRGHTKHSPGVIDVKENIPLTMKCLHTKMVGDQQRKGDASLELTRGQIEKTLVLEGEDRTGGSHDKPSVLIDNGGNAVLTRKVQGSIYCVDISNASVVRGTLDDVTLFHGLAL